MVLVPINRHRPLAPLIPITMMVDHWTQHSSNRNESWRLLNG